MALGVCFSVCEGMYISSQMLGHLAIPALVAGGGYGLLGAGLLLGKGHHHGLGVHLGHHGIHIGHHGHHGHHDHHHHHDAIHVYPVETTHHVSVPSTHIVTTSHHDHHVHHDDHHGHFFK